MKVLLFLILLSTVSAQWSQLTGAFTNATNAVGNGAVNFGQAVANSTRNFFGGSQSSDMPIAPPQPMPPMYSQCMLTDQSGYNLEWKVINNALLFNLTFTNFPNNGWTGVGWGANMGAGIDALLVQTQGSKVQVVSASVMGRNAPVPDSSNIATTYSTSYKDNTLRASFSRPLDVSGMPSLNYCNVWNFIVHPGGFANGQYTIHSGVPTQYTICNVANMCGNNNGITNGAPSNNAMASTSMQYNQNNQSPTPGMNRQFNPSSGDSNQMGQGRSYGYVPNTSTPPVDRPYTGAPFQYTTTMNPTWGTGSQQNSAGSNNMGQGQNNYNSNSIQYGSTQGNQMYGSNRQYNPTNAGNNNNNMQYSQGYDYNGNVQRNPPNQPNQNNYQYPPYSSVNQQQSMQNQYSMPNNAPQQNNYQSSQYGPVFGRYKRQTPGYQPTNNIYGYDINSGSGSATSAPLVVNPNYAYLNNQLASEYAQTYGDAVRQYEQNGGSQGFSGSAGSSSQPNFYNQGYVAFDAPVVSNQQQNQQNYGFISQQSSSNNGYSSSSSMSGSSIYNNGYAYNPPSGVYMG